MLQEKVPAALAANYAVWPVAHTINFSMVPPEGRVAYVNAVGVLWTAYLSSQSQGPATPAHVGLEFCDGTQTVVRLGVQPVCPDLHL